jgi:hypothetical protein
VSAQRVPGTSSPLGTDPGVEAGTTRPLGRAVASPRVHNQSTTGGQTQSGSRTAGARTPTPLLTSAPALPPALFTAPTPTTHDVGGHIVPVRGGWVFEDCHMEAAVRAAGPDAHGWFCERMADGSRGRTYTLARDHHEGVAA